MAETTSPDIQEYKSLLLTDTIRTDNANDCGPYDHIVKTSPLISWKVKEHIDNAVTTGDLASNPAGIMDQYALLGHIPANSEDDPVLLNTKIPWSAFLCGSQGSGKSHTLSCMLEGCLLENRSIGRNPNPLAGIIFHYDTSQSNGACEAAYLCSKVKKTRVLVSACNMNKMQSQYEDVASRYRGTIEVNVLKLNAALLDAERIKTLMAVGTDGEMPLYMHSVMKTLRQMAIEVNDTNVNFSEAEMSFYEKFKSRVRAKSFTGQQNSGLELRLDLLDSYIDEENRQENQGLLCGKPGELIIVDLTDPLTDPESACVLFDTCLSIFLAQSKCGKIVALDEAHNYMSETNAAAKQFTNRLLKTIREQRHQGARVVVATQEPTIDTDLLDLCSLTMVHRFTSPAWFEVLKKHITGLCIGDIVDGDGTGTQKKGDRHAVFQRIVQLDVGESLLFCPTAALTMENGGGNGKDGRNGEKVEIVKMMQRYENFRTRKRITADGGQSKLAGE